MQPIQIDSSDLSKLDKRFAQAAGAAKGIKREVLGDVGERLLTQVRSRIEGTGKVQRWQEKYLGSGGGYTAVRAKAKTYDEKGYAVGYVTNAIESGHMARGPSGKAKRYVPRVHKTRIPGKGMYAAVNAETVASQAADELTRKLTENMGG